MNSNQSTSMTQKNDTIGTRDPLMVANYLVAKSLEKDDGLTPLQLIKLVYIAHGWFLAFYDKPLLREPVQAWKYGPVVPSVYHIAKTYGRDHIQETFSGAENFENLKEQEKELLDEVLRVYGKYNGVQLSSLTHSKGTPWQKIWDGTLFEDIPDDVIKEYYAQKKQNEK